MIECDFDIRTWKFSSSGEPGQREFKGTARINNTEERPLAEIAAGILVGLQKEHAIQADSLTLTISIKP